ncbi:MAG: M2 family metallopeptidase [Pirellulales bacterium]|nr:M2 family metallopeptidase [Pirellulales bacterium]
MNKFSKAAAIAAFMTVSATMFTIVACHKGDDSVDKNGNISSQAKAFLDDYQQRYAQAAIKAHLAEWKAANTGKKEDFDEVARTELAVKKLHSDPEEYAKIVEFQKSAGNLSSVDARALDVAELAFKANQLPPELMDKMVKLSADISHQFNTYRAQIDGKKYSNNDLLEMLGKENDSAKRKQIWEALKQVGVQVAPKLIELAKVRNQAAEKLGYENYWDMKIRLQEHDPKQLIAIFDELEQMTDEPFEQMKTRLDAELAQRFKIKPQQMRPWHYDNPFFQSAPHSSKVDLDEFYKSKPKENIVKIAETFFADIGLPIEDIVKRSDLYEREGKDQHAFCTSIDRADDVRTLLNIKPTAEWMDTMLHEQGHAVYDLAIDRDLPFNLREPAHTFTTEAVAMLCGALAKNPAWLVEYAGADKTRVDELKEAILEQRRREQLVFARWTMVMFNFERALYDNPDQDLNKLWWDLVERFQLIERPGDRDAADWAAKPHFTIAPVYYHNYMLGELFAAQLRKTLAEMVGHKGPTSTLNFNGRKQFGEFLREKVFRPGASKPWPQFVEEVTGKKLSPKDYAEEVK